MFGDIEILSLSRSLATYSGARQTVVAENVANADTPGYTAQDLPDFEQAYRSSDTSSEIRRTREGHLGSAEVGGLDVASENQQGEASPNGNNVSLEGELVRAADVRSKHNLALSVYSTSLDILRASIGRGR
ncbi:MAG: FlgB family protein [Paracoccaceae bacterium]|nr:FlgB family protein [Paracoccaceae bacterium]